MSIARNLLLAAATNHWLRERAMKVSFVRSSVSHFMPGERLEDALAAATTLQAQGVASMVTKLGENVGHAQDAVETTVHYLDAINRITAAGLNAQVSVKPTQLGLDVDRVLCLSNLERLVDRATELQNLVWIDMESSGYVDRTIELYGRLRERSPRVGLALQAYLYRTAADLDSLVRLGATIRLVKGAYLEPPGVAFHRKTAVDERYFAIACRLLDDDALRAGSRLQIATHDRRLIGRLSSFIAARGLPSGCYEYAMLYGIQRPLQQRLAQSGAALRVLISYGEQWFPWYMRRLAESPANVGFVLRHLVSR